MVTSNPAQMLVAPMKSELQGRPEADVSVIATTNRTIHLARQRKNEVIAERLLQPAFLPRAARDTMRFASILPQAVRRRRPAVSSFGENIECATSAIFPPGRSGCPTRRRRAAAAEGRRSADAGRGQ